MAKAKKLEFPYRKQDDKALADGAQVARARYYRAVKADALAIFKDANDPEELSGAEDPEVQEEFITDQIDAHAKRTSEITPDALATIMQSDRWTAMGDAVDEGRAGFDNMRDVSEVIGKIAYWAYRQDLSEQIDALRSEGVEGAEANPGKRSLERYTPAELRNKPSLSSGHTDELKVEEQVSGVPTRFWLSRMSVADGETHAVHVEQLVDGYWQVVHDYGRPSQR